MRSNSWLKNQLEFLLKKYFPDVKISNPIEIKFGREAKYRFGSIRLVKPRVKFHLGGGTLFTPRVWTKKNPQKSIITITSLFTKGNVPADVVRYTICHELTHYAHGFSSQNKRLFKHPHHGGIVNRELEERGAEDLISAFKKWLKIYRKKILSGAISV